MSMKKSRIEVVITVFKWLFAAIFLMFFAAICTIVSPIITHKPKIHTGLDYEKYKNIDLYDKPHVLPLSSENINLYFVKDNRPGRMLFYVFHDAQISNLDTELSNIINECMVSLTEDKDVKLYQREDIPFTIDKFVDVFDERFMPEWWTAETLQTYEHNKLVALQNSGFWIFYSKKNNLIKVFQWHDSKEDLALLDRGLFEEGLMDSVVDAIKTGNIKLAEELIISNPKNVFIGDKGKTALHYAIEDHNEEFAGFLIDNGFDKDSRDNELNTPLYLAVVLNDKSMVEFLISKNVELDCAVIDGSTPLFRTIVDGSKEIELLLVKAGVNIKSDVGYTAIHAAVIKGDAQAVKFWIEKGINVNANINPYDVTPLHTAINEKNIEMVDVLMANGADITLRNRFGQTALELARSKGYKDIDRLICDYIKKR